MALYFYRLQTYILNHITQLRIMVYPLDVQLVMMWCILVPCDTPPSFEKNSNVNFKMKISKEGVGALSLTCSTLGVRGA
jgi:hypothetical protein